MADIVLGIGTSHTPLLSLQPEPWLTYAEGDFRNPELAFPPNGWVMPYHDGVEYVSPEVRAKFTGTELQSLPRERLFSATSESSNWAALGGALQHAELRMELLAYVPVYRTPAATGGGWAFARWQ